ncbi:MAG TPA: choice-of-anchor tandem repeat GloVer-containing protein, partial [Candidatus Eisenbacteria bacterium]|nr:choice-of-anchor tandem repeat GloVer-containing protein [Candidatus Eisenbacteria bacterium]
KDGESPSDGPVTFDSMGNIYGTTVFGGTSQNCNGAGCGVAYKLDASGHETVIYNFTGEADGKFPQTGLTMDSAGNLYGATANGGDLDCPVQSPNGCGVVFKITP